jgi:hypothetical protein
MFLIVTIHPFQPLARSPARVTAGGFAIAVWARDHQFSGGGLRDGHITLAVDVKRASTLGVQ